MGVFYMVQNKTRIIDRMIRRTFIEMFLVIFAVIGSYFIFSNSNLTSSASIAEEYSNSNYDLQVMIGKNENDGVREKNLLDKTVLTVRNPNKTSKYVDVYLVITNPLEVDINGMVIKFRDNVVDASKAILDLNTYKIKIYSGTIDAYENLAGDVSIYSNNYVNSMKYTFTVNESYYK